MVKPCKSFFKRAGWLFLVLLFLITGLGVGVVAFFQNIHQTKDSSQNSQTVCNIQAVGTSTILTAPEVYKTDAKVAKLQTTDLQAGSGPVIKSGDCLSVKYYGTLAKNGSVFDENYDKPTALQYQFDKQQVIPGWDQGLPGAKVGTIRRLVIPSALGYGPTGACKTQNQKDPSKCDEYSIPPNTDLVFVVDILNIK